jgi:hypothetical protein
VKGRLNLFQASMVRWRELHPYNAVHVMRIGKPLTVSVLQQAIDDVLARFGLTGLNLDIAKRRFEYEGGAAHAPVRLLPPGPDPAETVRAEIETQLNTPFARAGRIDPFRFFALDRGESFDLGLAYDHFIAAGDSIVVLLKAIGERYGGGTLPIASGARALYPPTYRRLFLRQLLPLLIGLRRIPAHVASFRRAYRPRYPYGHDGAMGFMRIRIDDPQVAVLRQTAKAWEVTINDLLLALLLQALSPLTEERRDQSRRNELAVASIVNIRGDCGAAARGAFGQFLSSFHVSHAVPPGVGLADLARDIRRATARVKREKLYLQTLFAMAAGGLTWRYLTPERRARFHGKAYPVWGGISSLHVDALWKEAAAGTATPEYVRAVPTGPLSPLVLAVTTVAGMLEIGISFRTAAFTRGQIDTMATSILDRVGRLCG